MPKSQVAIVGAGIVGLAHAWCAAERGHAVTVFERSPQASGASVRNFGMIWAIGQPAGGPYSTALRSRERWLELAKEAHLWVSACGSIHLAHHLDEWAVLQEFASLAPQLGYQCTLLNRDEVLQRSPAANPNGLLGGLFSPTELCVNPPVATKTIANWLAAQFGVKFEFNTAIASVDRQNLQSADRRRWDFDRAIICGGADVVTLFPDVLANSGLRQCKLQMLKTRPQPIDWRLGPHLAGGLTLRHYRNFEICPSLSALKQRVAAETPELDQFGIHVMASQSDQGEVVLGDSHEYDSEIEPFDKTVIDELILRELRSIIALPDWTVDKRWHGSYAKHPSGEAFRAEPQPNIAIRMGIGGTGMTMSFGLAERDWEQWS